MGDTEWFYQKQRAKACGWSRGAGGRAEGPQSRAAAPLWLWGRVVRKLPDQGALRGRRRRMTTSWKSGQEGPGTETGGLGQVNKESRAREQDSQEELCPEEPQS